MLRNCNNLHSIRPWHTPKCCKISQVRNLESGWKYTPRTRFCVHNKIHCHILKTTRKRRPRTLAKSARHVWLSASIQSSSSQAAKTAGKRMPPSRTCTAANTQEHQASYIGAQPNDPVWAGAHEKQSHKGNEWGSSPQIITSYRDRAQRLAVW